MQLSLPSATQALDKPEWARQLTSLHIKRDDQIHPVISGNKARKLLHLIQNIKHSKPEHLLTMGGNRSNFLHALAYFCDQEEITLSAFIRGEPPKHYSQTLQDLCNWNTQLHFVERQEFQRLRSDKAYADRLAEAHSAQWLHEGGSDAQALQGIIQAVAELEKQPDTLFVPIGTGCTALGLAIGLEQRGWNTQVIGVVVLKGADGKDGIEQDISTLAHDAGFKLPSNLNLEHRFCGKGFGKQSAELKQKQNEFERLWDVPLDPVYTVKMCNAFKQYAEEQNPRLGKSVLLWHTGGLQGNQ